MWKSRNESSPSKEIDTKIKQYKINIMIPVEMRVPRLRGFFTKDIGEIAEKHKNSIN